MDDHSIWQERISASLDGELDPEEERELQEHLASCAACRSAMALLRGMQTVLGGEEAEPPEALAKGTRYLYEQEQKRGLNLKRWRFTAIAAVICLALLGAATLGPWGSRATRTANAKQAEDTEKLTYNSYVAASQEAAPAGMAAEAAPEEEAETQADSFGGTAGAAGATGGASAPAPMATMYSSMRGVEGSGAGEADGAESPAAEDSGANGEPGAPADQGVPAGGQKSALYYADTLPGYSVYRELENADRYYSVSFVYGQVPETIRTNSGCVMLDAPEGQERWLVPLEICQNEGYLDQFDEIYYGDLLSQQGLVIGLLDIQEEEWLP